ncbi:MAG: ABC transporter ATP-binding protein [Pseudomonadota bacterium]
MVKGRLPPGRAEAALNVRAVTVPATPRLRLSEVSLSVAPGECVGFVGPNGAGKSTLLKAIAQLIDYRGEVSFGARDLRAMSLQERARQLAYLGQGGRSAWPLSVRDFVALGRMPHRQRRAWPWQALVGRRVAKMEVAGDGVAGPPAAVGVRAEADADGQAIAQALAHTGLEAMAERPVGTLSGGEFARARLARALAVEAPLLLADEPVAALDPYHQLKLMELLRTQCEHGRTAIVVLHDLTLASRFCDRLLLLDRGEALACDVPRRVLTRGYLQRVYQVEAVVGEYRQQPFIVPWACERGARATGSVANGGVADRTSGDGATECGDAADESARTPGPSVPSPLRWQET